MGKLMVDGRNITPKYLVWRDVTEKPVTVQAVQIFAPFTVETLEGQHHGNPGDFLIRGVQGELYPCKPDIFRETYEAPEGLFWCEGCGKLQDEKGLHFDADHVELCPNCWGELLLEAVDV